MDGQAIDLVRVETCDVLWHGDEGLISPRYAFLIREQLSMRDALVKMVRDLFALCRRRSMKAHLFLIINALETRLKSLVNLRDYSFFFELMSLVCLAQ